MGKVREALFSMLEARGLDWPSARVLDVFAGSGSLGFEAVSRGAAEVCFVESAPYAAKVIASNAALLGLGPDRVKLLQSEAAKALARGTNRPYDVVFIDPPYALDALGNTLSALLGRAWVRPGSLINAEVEAKRPFDPEKAHPDLALVADRTYGQTRVILWNTNPA